MESDFIENMEPSSELRNDISKTSKEDENEYIDSDSDGGINGLPFMMEPDTIIDESDEDFSLDVMNSLSHDVPDIESMRKYSDMLFGATEGTVYCDYCAFISDNILELKIYMSTAHDGLKVHCIQCEFTATRRDTLLNHVRKVHEGKGFPCEQCEYVAGTRQHLQRHYGVSTKESKNKNTKKERR